MVWCSSSARISCRNSPKTWCQSGSSSSVSFTNFPALCAKLFFKKPKDWFSINRHEVEKCGGRSLFKIYRSFPEALQVIFPDLRDSLVEAQIQQTSRAPAGFWQNKEHQKQLIERVGKELGVKEVWFKILPFPQARIWFWFNFKAFRLVFHSKAACFGQGRLWPFYLSQIDGWCSHISLSWLPLEFGQVCDQHSPSWRFLGSRNATIHHQCRKTLGYSTGNDSTTNHSFLNASPLQTQITKQSHPIGIQSLWPT